MNSAASVAATSADAGTELEQQFEFYNFLLQQCE